MFQHNSWDHDKLIGWAIESLPVSYPPGTHWAYSNFGYCVLGRVIEQITGQPYADYVQANVLAPCGISGMRIAGNTLHQRAPKEVIYVGQYNEDPYRMNVTRMDSHGGWIATPSSLVQFLDHVNGFGNMASLLRPETVRLYDHSRACLPGVQRRSLRPWLDGAQRGPRKLVARREPARIDQPHGSHSLRTLLGGARKHPHPALKPNRRRYGRHDVADRPRAYRNGAREFAGRINTLTPEASNGIAARFLSRSGICENLPVPTF